MKQLPAFTKEKPLQLMEVCGGHTHAIFRFGLDKLLPKEIEFIHGPGCPVCVLPMGRIDSCAEIAGNKDVIFCTFGDAVRVPGKNGSLLQAREQGGEIRVVYSPLDALALAQKNPDKQIVFFALGFETTMPVTAVTLQQAKKLGLKNFTIFCQHISIIPTLRSLLEHKNVHIDAFLAPGHVSMVIGSDPYEFIAKEYKKPMVVTGFEPVDILKAISMLLDQFIEKRCAIENEYGRVVPREGNPLAQKAIAEIFKIGGSSEWRGLGMIEDSGISLTEEYQEFDAERRFNPQEQQAAEDPRARCGEVLTGQCKPKDCPLFATECNPENAFGALMVSSEGACAAYYQYRRSEGH
ncbi:hydrogenase expression formation protein [Lasius niger]|uniref:Hydrogenase expression formation protein n=1 Tax=Lasius niger TaxID=67767 RepID=A0A0J7KJ79_LASNI|nr:hydrogenase expression formation protein [Lasius niger]